MATEGTNKGTFANIYEVNKKFPGGGAAGEYVVILGFKHYWNPDRNNWCVNENRDEYWDEVLGAATTAANEAIIAVQTEQAEREAGDAALQAKINAEESAREAGDAALQSGLEGMAKNVKSMIDEEESAREAGDAALQAKIESEEAERETRDAELSKRIDDEVSARAAADVILQNTMSTFQNSLNEESSARAAADSHLQELITIETQTRSNADAELQKDIEEEATTRQAALEGLAKNVKSMLDEEKAVRLAGDTALTEALNNLESKHDAEAVTVNSTLSALALGAKAGCSINPTIMYRSSEPQSVGVTASISAVTANEIVIKSVQNGVEKEEESQENTSKFTELITVTPTSDITFKVEANYNGAIFPASAVLYAVDKIYYGAGASASAATNVASPRRTPTGTYGITTKAGDYVWWLVPSTMSISKATLNGFNFPITQDGTTNKDGVSYKIYKSENQYSASTMNIVVS